MRVSDDEVAKLSVPENERVGEGATDSYGVVLTQQPAAAVTVTVTSKDSAALTVANSDGGSSLTFSTTNWDTAQRLTLTGVQDDDGGNETVTVTHALTGSTDYAGTSEDTEVRVIDDEELGLELDAERIAVGEGGSDGKYAVNLSAKPTGAVTVRLTIGTDVVVGAQSYAAVATLTPTQLTFTTDNYSTKQTVTVSPQDDADSDTEERTIRHTARGASEYVGVGAGLPLTVTDDDAAAGTRIVLSETSLTAREGGRAVYELSLAHVPGAAVTVALTSGDTAVATVLPAALTFTAANFDTPQRVVVTAENDDDSQNGSTTISHAASGHSTYSGATASLAVAVEDDSEVAIRTPAQRSWEEGKATSYGVQLSAQPTANVTVTLSTTESNVDFLGPTALTFTDGDWNSQQIVVLRASHDGDDEDETLTLTHTASGASEYAGVTRDMSLTIYDDDEKAPLFAPSSLLLGEADEATLHGAAGDGAGRGGDADADQRGHGGDDGEPGVADLLDDELGE